MNIAYVSYEHPLGISGGGIGTYIGQIAKLMANRGHVVEVFSANQTTSDTVQIDDYQLHFIKSNNVDEFRFNVLSKFEERHQVINFQIIECAEYGADALFIKKKIPNLPLTIKLHTPTFLVSKLNNYNLPVFSKLRFIISGLLRGKMVKPYWLYKKENDLEYELFNLANSVSSPSKSLKQIVEKKWGLKDIKVIPNIFVPPKNFNFSNYVDNEVLNIVFVGKLETRKGILDLMKAIPNVLKTGIKMNFIFVGSALASPKKGLNMDEYISLKLSKYMDSISFTGFIKYDNLADLYKIGDVFIFPSIWENFPTVCLESMSANRVVIGTNNGGMAEIIEDRINGILIPPNKPKYISKSLIELNSNRNLLRKISINSRKKIIESYNGNLLGKIIEDFYQKTINKN